MSRWLGRKPQDPDYGVGEHAFDADRLGLVGEAELTERLTRAFASPSYHPPRLPAVAAELLALSQRPDVSFREIEAVLEHDPVLAGEVLSIARSAFYAGIRPVKTLQAALVRIGLVRLREIVLETALNMRVFRCSAYQGCMDRLRRHSQATANLCRILSRYAPVTQDQAFLSGLLHDVGIAGILLVLGEVERGRAVPDITGLWPAIHAAHASAGARMVELWKLPVELAAGIAAHHEVRFEGADHPMAAAICLAEELSASLGFGLAPEPGQVGFDAVEASGLLLHRGTDRSRPVAIERARAALRMTDPSWNRVRAEAEDWRRTWMRSGEGAAARG